MSFAVVAGVLATEAAEHSNKRSFYNLNKDTKGGFYA